MIKIELQISITEMIYIVGQLTKVEVAVVMEMLPMLVLMLITFPPELLRTPEAEVMAATLATFVLNTSII